MAQIAEEKKEVHVCAMAGKSLSDIVTDWGGFERLVAQLHETGTVTVEHNVTLTGRSGAPRQIDVLVRHTEGLYEHLIVVECKYRNAAVERLHVDALTTTIHEVGASRGVIFSTEGFQKGAIDQARHENISLFRLREPTNEEWGLPGRHVDVWLQVVSIGVGNLQTPGTMLAGPGPAPVPPLNLDIRLGFPEHVSKTAIRAEGKPDATLEDLIGRLARAAARLAYKPVRIDFGGRYDGEIKNVIRVNFAPEKATLIFIDRATIIVPRITFELGLRVSQKRLEIDRGAPYAFVLAVEDCVRNVVTTASRAHDEAITKLAAVVPPSQPSGPAWQNGSIISVWLGPFEQFSEFAGIEPAVGPEVKMKL